MNIGKLLMNGYELLKAENIESYMIDTQLLLQKVLNKDKLFIMINRDYEVDEESEKEFYKLILLRKNRMPVKYILGECEFMGMNFFIREGVLIPRPDTEILVEEIIGEIKKNNFTTICDVCCGSGAIGVSIAKFVDYTNVVCYDICEKACEVTQINIDKFFLRDRVKVINSDLLENALNSNNKFEVIVSNPPYIREDVIPTLMDDVKNFEPHIALYGGKDGLDFYRKITQQSLVCLISNGILAYEIGHDQGKAVSDILEDKGFENVRIMKDLAGHDRVVLGFKL